MTSHLYPQPTDQHNDKMAAEPKQPRPGGARQSLLSLLSCLLLLGLVGFCLMMLDRLGAIKKQQRLRSPLCLHLTSEPAWAAVLFDGRYVGRTPLTLSDVAKGRHDIELSRRGYLTQLKTIRVNEEDVEIHVTLDAQATGSLSVRSEPEGADVYLDGDLIGVTPSIQSGVPIGRHNLKIQRVNYAPWQKVVEVNQKGVSLEAALLSKEESYYLGQISNDPDAVSNYRQLARFYMDQKELDKALDVFSRGLAILGPKSSSWDIRLLQRDIYRLYFGRDGHAAPKDLDKLREKVILALEKAIERAPQNIRTYKFLATFYEQRASSVSSGLKIIDLLSKALANATDEKSKAQIIRELTRNMYNKAWRLERKRDYKDAIRAYESIVEKYPQSYQARRAMNRISFIYERRLRKPDSAIAAKRRFIELFPGDDDCPTIQLEIAQAYAEEMNDFKRAIEEFRKFIAKYPNDDRCAMARQTIASHLLFNLKKYEEGAEAYREFINKHPDDDACAQAQYNIAFHAYYKHLKNYEKAAQEYEKFLTDYPKDDRCNTILLSLASLYLNRLKQPDKAIETYRRILTYHPTSDNCVMAQTQIGYVYFKALNDYKKAIEEYEKALKNYPDYDGHLMTMKYLGDCYLHLGNRKKARQVYEEAIAKYAYNPAVEQIEKSLYKLQD